MRAVILGLMLAGLCSVVAVAEDAGGRDFALPAVKAVPAPSGPPTLAVLPPLQSGKPQGVSVVAKGRAVRNPLPSEDDEDDTPELSLPLPPGSSTTLRLGSRDADPVSGSTSRRQAGLRPSIAATDRDAAVAHHVRAGLGRGMDKDLRFGLSFDIP